jgi:hypothetical protein
MVTLTISRPSQKAAVSVPAQSITYIEGKPVVFAWTGSGFAVTPVSVLGKTADIATPSSREGHLPPEAAETSPCVSVSRQAWQQHFLWGDL